MLLIKGRLWTMVVIIATGNYELPTQQLEAIGRRSICDDAQGGLGAICIEFARQLACQPTDRQLETTAVRLERRVTGKLKMENKLGVNSLSIHFRFRRQFDLLLSFGPVVDVVVVVAPLPWQNYHYHH